MIGGRRHGGATAGLRRDAFSAGPRDRAAIRRRRRLADVERRRCTGKEGRRRTSPGICVVAIIAVVLCSAVGSPAQGGPPVGSPAGDLTSAAGAIAPGSSGAPEQEEDSTPEWRSVRDGVYTERQAERGERIFANACGPCHTTEQFVRPGYLDAWRGATVGGLYRVLRRTMPQDNPGGLEPEEYVEVLAYVFELNDWPTGDDELEADVDVLDRVILEEPDPAEEEREQPAG